MNYDKYLTAAKKSPFGLWKLNFGLSRMIPFNRPHGIRIETLEDDKVITRIPYKRKNLNHIKGIHACGLATCAEFASGFHLLTKLGVKKYRIIMQSIEVDFLYQAKSNVVAEFEANDAWIEEHVVTPLAEQEKIVVQCEIKLFDAERNHVATACTNWQIKSWEKVKTKL